MIQGAYSLRFKSAENHHVEHIKQIHEGERADMLERSRRLQQETNRRRKALAVKRKLDAQKEEKRRQEILNRRREQMQEATERYQRLNRPHSHQYDPEEETYEHGSSHHAARNTPALEDALRAIRGSSARVVRQHSYDGVKTRASSAGTARAATTYSGRENVPIDPLSRAYPKSYGSQAGSAVVDRTADPAIAAASHLELQNKSLRNLTNSRSRFEQQLEQQQTMLSNQHKASLRQFGAAVWRELEAEHEAHAAVPMQRTESITSVDSLEDDTKAQYGSDPDLSQPSHNLAMHASHSDSDLLRASHQPNRSNGANLASASASAIGYDPNIQTNTSPSISSVTPVAAAATQANVSPSSFILHRSMSSPSNVAVVQPSVVRPTTDDNEQFFTHKSLIEKTEVAYNQRGHYPNHAHELRLEDAHEQISDKLRNAPCTFPMAIEPTPPPYPAHPPRHEPVVNYVTTLGTNFQTSSGAKPVSTNGDSYMRSSEVDASQGRLKAWAAPSPATPITAHAGSISSSQLNGASKSSSTHTSAAHASPVNSAYKGMFHTHDYRMPTKSFSETDLSNAVNHHNSHSIQQREELDGDAQSQDSLGEEEEDEEEKEKEPKSILKRRIMHGPPTPTSLRNLGLGVRGQNTASINARKASFTCVTPVRDSIEYTRGQMHSQSETQITRKKSVRFADLTYDDESAVDGELVHQQQSQLARSFNQQDLQELQEKQQHKKQEQQQQQRQQQQQQQNTTDKPAVQHKPPRPISAKITSSTLKVDPAVKEPRILSAGTQRRGTYSRGRIITRKLSPRQANASPSNAGNKTNSVSVPVTHPSSASGNPTMSSRIPIASAPNQYNVHNPVNGQKQDSDGKSHVTGGPVYDSSGMRLDRTPTDDEINWLWDKVRTCLSRNSTVGSVNDNHSDHNSVSSSARQVAPVANKCIDGGNLNPQLRTAERINPTYPSNSAVVAPKKKMTMDNLNNYTKRNNPRPNVPQATAYGNSSHGISSHGNGSHGISSHSNSSHSNSSHGISSNGNSSYGNNNSHTNINTAGTSPGYAASNNTGYTNTNVPAGRTAGGYQVAYPPNQNSTITTNGNGPERRPVSESMAAFLTAEVLSQRSVSESQIQHAMETAQHQQHNYIVNQPQQKVPTALSIEEQRLLQSLERLNDRLKMTETAITTSNYVPRPPPHRPGFRGHNPITGHARRNSATVNGTVSRHNFRTYSAGSVRSGTSRY